MSTLLVVEDEVLTTDFLRRYFGLAGYEVISAQTGIDAIRLAIHHQPEIIILDIVLPDTDGYAVCKKLRGDARTSHIPVIFLTGKDRRSDRLDGLELGADDYLTKPFDAEDLRLRVQTILDRQHGEGKPPLVDPETSLPNRDLVTERLPELLELPESVFLDVQIKRYDDFATKYGVEAVGQVVRTTAKLIGDLLHEIDTERTFLGHPRDDHFLLGLPQDRLDRLRAELSLRFGKQVLRFYDTSDQRRGSMKLGYEEVPFMSLKVVRVKREALRVFVARQVRRRKLSSPPRLPAEIGLASEES